jgi:hypothetical protein
LKRIFAAIDPPKSGGLESPSPLDLAAGRRFGDFFNGGREPL